MIRENSPRARIVVARLVAGTAPEPLPGAHDDQRGDEVHDHRHRDRDRDRARDRRHVAGIDGESEGEEEQRGEGVAQRQHELAHAWRDRGLGDHEPGHERADGVGHVDLLGDARDEHGEPDEAHGEELVLFGADDAARRTATRRSARSARRSPGSRSALANESTASTALADSSSTGWSAARYTARNRSSTTTMPRIRRVSRLVRRCISTRILVTIADDEMPDRARDHQRFTACPSRARSRTRAPAPMLSPR